MRFAYIPTFRRKPAPWSTNPLIQPKPLVTFSLIGPNGTAVERGLVDTGSDETLVYASLATAIGLDLRGAPAHSFAGQGGGRLIARFAQVTMRMSDGKEFREWPAWVGFVSGGLRRPVLGFGGFLQFFTATFLGDDEAVELSVNRLYPGT